MSTVLPLWFEVGSLIVLVLLLVFDLLIILKRPHIPSMKEATGWVVFYVVLALIFAGLMFAIGDTDHGVEFLAGWLTEYSLSIDNLFVFVIILSRFSVPKKYQQEVLMVGIIVALIFRGAFILAGAWIIELFVGVFYIFGIFLLYTAFKQAFGDEEESDEDTGFVKFLKKRINYTDEYDGNKLRTSLDGVKHWTPMLLVFLAVGTTDVMFALDSIPRSSVSPRARSLCLPRTCSLSWVCVSCTSCWVVSWTGSNTSSTGSRRSWRSLVSSSSCTPCTKPGSRVFPKSTHGYHWASSSPRCSSQRSQV